MEKEWRNKPSDVKSFGLVIRTVLFLILFSKIKVSCFSLLATVLRPNVARNREDH